MKWISFAEKRKIVFELLSKCLRHKGNNSIPPGCPTDDYRFSRKNFAWASVMKLIWYIYRNCRTAMQIHRLT